MIFFPHSVLLKVLFCAGSPHPLLITKYCSNVFIQSWGILILKSVGTLCDTVASEVNHMLCSTCLQHAVTDCLNSGYSLHFAHLSMAIYTALLNKPDSVEVILNVSWLVTGVVQQV